MTCSSGSSDLPLEFVAGDGEPVLGAKVSIPVSPAFARDDALLLYSALQSPELRTQLLAVSCGADVTHFSFTVSLWKQAPMHVRHVEVREEPWLENRPSSECLVGGMMFFAYNQIARTEKSLRLRGGETRRAGPNPPGMEADECIGMKGVSCDCAALSKGESAVSYQYCPSY